MAGRGGEDDVNLVITATLKQRGCGATDEVMDNLQVCAATLNSGGNNGGFRTEPGEHLVIHALTSEGFAASEDGTGRGIPLVLAQNGGDIQVGTQLGAPGAGQARQTSGDLIAIQDIRAMKKKQNGLGINEEGLAYTLDGTGSQGIAAPLTASYGKQIDNSDRNGGPPNLIHGVRRLTVIECERLQGFPDGFTCLCQPLEAYVEDPDEAHLRCTCADSPRYKSLGNAVTVSVACWLGEQLRSVAP